MTQEILFRKPKASVVLLDVPPQPPVSCFTGALLNLLCPLLILNVFHSVLHPFKMNNVSRCLYHALIILFSLGMVQLLHLSLSSEQVSFWDCLFQCRSARLQLLSHCSDWMLLTNFYGLEDLKINAFRLQFHKGDAFSCTPMKNKML